MSDMNNTVKPVLTIRDLSVEFPVHKSTVKAVEGLSFELRRGETLCVVGESGSGKSVTARAILRLLQSPGRITSGEITFEGRDLTQVDPKGAEIRAIRGDRIAMIFQEPMTSLSPVHTIGAQIIETILLHRDMSKAEARERAIELLGRVAIPSPEVAVDRYAFEYSGGMRQRAMIAMALACDPDILIADEPTTALDVTTQAEILRLIEDLQRETGMAVLFITHDMGVVAEIADRVMVMYRGHKVEEGLVQDVLQRPQEDYTKALLASVLKLETPPERTRPDANAARIYEVNNLNLVFGQKKGAFKKDGGGVWAINGVTLDVRQGESLGIVGESGSGKTTLGRTMLRMLEPTAGQLQYRNAEGGLIDLTAARRSDMRRLYGDMRMVFQDPHSSLNPRMTVRETIAEPLRTIAGISAKERDERVAELLERVGMPQSAASRYPHAFSGGQRQRISIARAIATHPRLVIADEPTSALDVSLRHRILDLMAELREEMGMTYVFISHDITCIRYFCDRVAVMERGKLVEVGSAEQICSAPTQPYTKRLIASVPHPDMSRRTKPLPTAA
ncbi:ABC transporter ATP-binding protein (plasmid) [Falsihalocynthiibacter sp. SS001]|uniref:ABC transporter ATP-binding protein n=1 Tax=Falsihalocynthiibacter sp. SS001 TaxID=3349698 RepID=UPI0036D2A100